MSLKEIIREKYTLRMIESNDPYISEDRREKISLRKRVATLSSEFPESSSVKTKGGKRGTVLSVGKDYVKVAHGNRQKDYHPSQLTREESEALKGPIEESYKKKYETAPEGVKAVADYMATLKKQPTDTLKRMANQHYKVHSANSKNELVGMLMRAKFGKKKLEAHDSHFQTEQKQGVAEEYTLQERINIADAEMGDVIKDFYKSNAPQFKGKSKEKRREMAIAAKLEADREAGIKESVSIDEASRSSLQEELKGNQHKIDKNKNGEIDSDDFKLLRLNPGDEVHVGHTQPGGSGMRGTVHKIEGDEVHVKVGSGKFGDRIVKGKLKNATLLHQEELKVLPRPPTKKNPKPGHNPPGSPGSDPRAGFTTPTPRGRAPSPHKSYDGDNKKGNGSNGAEPHTIRSNAHVKENRSVVDRILEARKKVSEKSKKKTATGQPITTIDTKPEIDSVGNAGNFRKP